MATRAVTDCPQLGVTRLSVPGAQGDAAVDTVAVRHNRRTVPITLRPHSIACAPPPPPLGPAGGPARGAHACLGLPRAAKGGFSGSRRPALTTTCSRWAVKRFNRESARGRWTGFYRGLPTTLALFSWTNHSLADGPIARFLHLHPINADMSMPLGSMAGKPNIVS